MFSLQRIKRVRRSGFTLIEVLIALAVFAAATYPCEKRVIRRVANRSNGRKGPRVVCGDNVANDRFIRAEDDPY